MADSKLSTKVKSTPPDNKSAWGDLEAAVEVITSAVENLGVAPVNTTANPGSDATKAVAVQGVTSGKPLAVKVDQTTPGSTNAVQPKQYTGVPSSFAIQTADQTVFTLAAGEKGFIQNLSADAPLAVKKGASASTTSLSFILAACTATSDGKGGAVVIDDWIGVVSVAKMTGTASYLAWKQVP
jgi:hypothetical protein